MIAVLLLRLRVWRWRRRLEVFTRKARRFADLAAHASAQLEKLGIRAPRRRKLPPLPRRDQR